MPRPNTYGSPPLSRTTTRPARACSTSSRLISSCGIERPPGTLAASMTTTSRRELVEDGQRRQPVGDHDVRLGQRGAATQREQAGVAGAAADEDDPAGRARAPAGGTAARVGALRVLDQPVAHRGGPAGSRSACTATRVRPGPPDRGDPRAGGGGVVGPHAEGPVALGVGGDGRR